MISLYSYCFLKGLATGVTIAAIGGPVGLLCIRRTLTEGVRAGCALGIGAALADALFGSIAGFGLTMLANMLLTYQTTSSIIGSCFLLYLGITTLTNKPQQHTESIPTQSNLSTHAATSFFITLTNPATILFFTALSVSLGIGITDYVASSCLVGGIFVGSTLWFSSLALVVSLFANNITPKRLAMVNTFFAIGLIIFAGSILLKNLYGKQ